MSIGSRIHLMRKARGMSQRALANEVGVSAMAISKYERDLARPSTTMLMRLSTALDTTVEALIRPDAVAIPVTLQVYRKHHRLGAREQEALAARIQEWLERYAEVESFVLPDLSPPSLPRYPVADLASCEDAAARLRDTWRIGTDAIDSVTDLLEDHGIKVGLIEEFDRFDACTFVAAPHIAIVSNGDVPGDRQRFSLCHELGHLVLDVQGDLDEEQACHRFASALLAPAERVTLELGARRSNLDPSELYALKLKYGLSMQAWARRARDVGVISEGTYVNTMKRFSARGWRRHEPGEPVPTEEPERMNRLIYRAYAEDLVSRSRALEFAQEPLDSDFMEAWRLAS